MQVKRRRISVKRVINILSVLLMLAGLGLLAYVGVSYERSQLAQPKKPSWTSAEREKGKKLATKLAHHQTVAVPTRLVGAVPPSGSEAATRLVIPKIAVDAPVVETAPVNGIWNVADWAVGHLSTTPNPGGPGNDALSAHDDIKGEIFKRLGELRPGDNIRLYTRHSVSTYVVTSLSTVDPSDVSVLDLTKSATVTLISCTPYWVDSQRLIVQGLLKTRAAA